MKERAYNLSAAAKLACGLAILLAVHLASVLHYYFVCDDAFISFRYLTNWLAGNGLVYNIGERVEGYTNFLWILVLAPFAKAGISAENAAPVLSIIFSFALVLLVFAFPYLISYPDKPYRKYPLWALLIAPLLLAVNRSYGIWATGGLETRMFSFLVFAGLVLTMRAVFRGGARPLILAGAVFGLAKMARPDAMLLAETAFALYFISVKWLGKPVSWRGLILGALLPYGVLLVHIAWRLSFYGQFLPNTYYVKVNQSWFSMGGWYLWMFCVEYALFLWPLMLLPLYYKSFYRKDPVPLFMVFIAVPYLVYVAYIGGDHFEYRMLDPVLPLIALSLSMAILDAWSSLKGRLMLRAVLVAMIVILVSLHVALPMSSGAHAPPRYQSFFKPQSDPEAYPGLRVIPFISPLARYFNRSYVRLIPHMVGIRWEEHKLFSLRQTWEADRLKQYIELGFLDSSEKICVQAAGIVPYYTGLTTLDYFGLTDDYVAHKRLNKPRQVFHDKRADLEYINSLGVDYMQYKHFLFDASAYGYKFPGLIPEWWGFEDPAKWYGRLYLVPIADTYFIFFSTLSTEHVFSRFAGRGLKVYVYVPVDHDKMYPLPVVNSPRGTWYDTDMATSGRGM